MRFSPLPACGERSTREARRVRGMSASPSAAETPPHPARTSCSPPSPRRRGEGSTHHPPGFTTRVRRRLSFFFPGQAGGAERRWTLPSERYPHREPTGSEPIGTGGVRPDAVSGQHPRTRPAALHSGVFCPRTVSECTGDAQGFTCVRSGHGGHLWRASRSGSRTVDRGLPGVIACHAQAPHHPAASANPRRLIRPRFIPTCRSAPDSSAAIAPPTERL
jgi:hypothetical protein